MKLFTDMNDPRIIDLLKSGAVGVLRTDTLYGIVGRADNEETVERIYAIKHRNESKSPIVLIASYEQLFDKPNARIQAAMDQEWPGKVSIIVPAVQAPEWLSRGNKSVAYRMPAKLDLQSLLEATGPLIAPSANPEGEVPAESVAQAQAYFGDSIDFYIDSGMTNDNQPSRLIRINQAGVVERLR